MDEFFNETNLPYKLHFNDSNLLDITFYDNSVVLDMFDTISYICYKDFYTKRDEDVNNKNKLNIEVPVYNYDIFCKCKEKLEYLIKFMTNGEIWNINFKKYNSKKIIDTGKLPLPPVIKYNSIALLSGGLDALAGTVFEKENKTIYVTFGTNDIEGSNASKVYDKIIDSSNSSHVYIKKNKFNLDEQYTERTRSLMFIGCCLIFCDFYKINTIKIYENGIMSLNPKFNFSRRVTKTTNQKTLFLINQLFKEIGINVHIENPFKYMTKADVISVMPSSYYDIILNDTRTCSKNPGIIHFSNKTTGNFHCGVCIACILRQIGTFNNSLQEYDNNYLLPIELYKLKDIENHEEKISKTGNAKQDKIKAKYKYLEKKSLLEYYKTFYRNIKSGKIYNYIDLNKKYYNDNDYYDRINKMLKNFSKELENYFDNLKE